MRTRRYRNRRIGDFLKELHLVEGRNTGIPTAIKAIKENGSPLPLFVTDEDRSFFSVIIPIHKNFIDGQITNNIKKTNYVSNDKKRKSKDDIKVLILEELEIHNYSANDLYSKLGYSGNASKTFRICIDELIKENKIHYALDNKQNGNNVLIKN